MSPVQLAGVRNACLVTVYNWKSGKLEPRASQLRALARHSGVTMDAIDFVADGDRNGDGGPQPEP